MEILTFDNNFIFCEKILKLFANFVHIMDRFHKFLKFFKKYKRDLHLIIIIINIILYRIESLLSLGWAGI